MSSSLELKITLDKIQFHPTQVFTTTYEKEKIWLVVWDGQTENIKHCAVGIPKHIKFNASQNALQNIWNQTFNEGSFDVGYVATDTNRYVELFSEKYLIPNYKILTPLCRWFFMQISISSHSFGDTMYDTLSREVARWLEEHIQILSEKTKIVTEKDQVL